MTGTYERHQPPHGAVVAAVTLALAEDLGMMGDITTACTVDDDTTISAVFAARHDGVLAGTACVTETYRQVDPSVVVHWNRLDGDDLAAGDVIGTVTGPIRAILTGERVALNFMGHLSGVATLTQRYVRAARGQVRVLDTRKTMPGLRALQKAAVRAGGGSSHRDSLSDAVLFKDNHLAVLGITRAVERARSRWPGRMVEVECDTLEQVAEALAARADRIMLDNMTLDEVRAAVALCDGAVALEVSGGVTLETIGEYAVTGIDFVSVGALTHSARVLDIGLDFP
jgi:nicotinate-nucleotide pyrophosphorylase (carboxylating)